MFNIFHKFKKIERATIGNITATYANQVMYNTILLMQDRNSGGVHTSYNSNLQAVGSTNTETTALVAIANPTNTTPTPTPTAEFPSLSVVIVFIALSLSITVVVMTARKRKIGKSKRWQNLKLLNVEIAKYGKNT